MFLFCFGAAVDKFSQTISKIWRRVSVIFLFSITTPWRSKFALGEFLSWEPTHVLILDYSERKTHQKAQKAQGRNTWRDLSASATGERLVRSGFEKYDYPNYIQLPFLMDDLRRILLG